MKITLDLTDSEIETIKKYLLINIRDVDNEKDEKELKSIDQKFFLAAVQEEEEMEW